MREVEREGWAEICMDLLFCVTRGIALDGMALHTPLLCFASHAALHSTFKWKHCMDPGMLCAM